MTLVLEKSRMTHGSTEWRYRFLCISLADSLWRESLKEMSLASPSFFILSRKNVSATSRLFRENRVDARHKLNATLKAPQSRSSRSRESSTNLNIKGTSSPNRNLNDGWGSFRSRWGLHRFIWFIPKNWIAVVSSLATWGSCYDPVDSQHPSWRSSIRRNEFLLKRVASNRRGGPFKRNPFREKFVGRAGWENFLRFEARILTVFETIRRHRGTRRVCWGKNLLHLHLNF